MSDDYTEDELKALCQEDDLEVVARALEKDHPEDAKRVRQSLGYQRQQLCKEWATLKKALYESLPNWLRQRLLKDDSHRDRGKGAGL